MKASPESTTTHISYIIEFCSGKLTLLQTSSEIKTSTTEVLSTTVHQSSLFQGKDENTISNDNIMS